MCLGRFCIQRFPLINRLSDRGTRAAFAVPRVSCGHCRPRMRKGTRYTAHKTTRGTICLCCCNPTHARSSQNHVYSRLAHISNARTSRAALPPRRRCALAGTLRVPLYLHRSPFLSESALVTACSPRERERSAHTGRGREERNMSGVFTANASPDLERRFDRERRLARDKEAPPWLSRQTPKPFWDPCLGIVCLIYTDRDRQG